MTHGRRLPLLIAAMLLGLAGSAYAQEEAPPPSEEVDAGSAVEEAAGSGVEQF